MLACTHNNKPIYEYTPLQVKQGVVGYGRAQKMQVQQMVTSLFKIKKKYQNQMILLMLFAIAVCHAHANRLEKTLKNFK